MNQPSPHTVPLEQYREVKLMVMPRVALVCGHGHVHGHRQAETIEVVQCPCGAWPPLSRPSCVNCGQPL